MAVVRIDFDGLARVVWIDDLAQGGPPAALSLCRRHADSLHPPRHWEMRDLRPAAGARAALSAAAGEPERSEPASDPSESVGADRNGTISLDPPTPLVIEEPAPAQASAAPAWSPRLFAEVDVGSVLDASSPLLSRAFRGI